MSKNTEDKIPEIQSSFVQNFLKQKLGKDKGILQMSFTLLILSCNYVKYFTNIIAKHNQGETKKKLTKQCILKGLTDIGFEDFADQLSEMQIDFKQTVPQQNKKTQQKEVIQSSAAHNDENIHEIVQPDQQNINENEGNQDEVLSDASLEQIEEINQNNEEIENQQQDLNISNNILDQIIGKQQKQDQNSISAQQYEEMF